MVAETQAQVTDLFALVADRFGDEYGRPLPQRLLESGDPVKGWCMRFNPTENVILGVGWCEIWVYHDGLMLGVIGPYGSCLMLTPEERWAFFRWIEALREMPA